MGFHVYIYIYNDKQCMNACRLKGRSQGKLGRRRSQSVMLRGYETT